MLRNFIYLNLTSLESYLSAMEDGLRNSAETRAIKSGAVKGGVNAKLLSVGGEKERGSEETTSRVDTPEARYERLDQLMRKDVKHSGWVDIAHGNVSPNDIKFGALVELECDIIIPDAIKILSSRGLGAAVEQLESLAQVGELFGADVEKMPSKDELNAMKKFQGLLGSDVMFIGESEDIEWSVAGKLSAEYLRAEVEGHARIVGKVSAQWGKGSWKPLLAIPGMNLLPRRQRREMEKKGPEDGQKDNWLEGPAIMLDVLAIYN
ncbi:hypothetical protein [Propionibacterium freudenreichii]|uniref:DUF6414 family protein n=1 Tax=Propionibacterium freudenreichii TaxID=1744 RepID=UPI0022FD8E42|nr:hypothetical protein [Propionibacterium freudenreichii]